MAENSKIEWTDHTFNPWRGCTKVSGGCKNCYAETLSKRNPKVLGMWGPRGTRVVASETMWREPIRWNAEAQASGERRRVFCASLADVFEGPETCQDTDAFAAITAARTRLFQIISSTPWLDWLLLTKRPEHIMEYVPESWQEHFPANIWIGTSVEDQETAESRIQDLLCVPAVVRFLSVEPLIGPIDFDDLPYPIFAYEAFEDCLHKTGRIHVPGIDWVIVGGESGSEARPMNPAWVRTIRELCVENDAKFFFKQWGEWQYHCFLPGNPNVANVQPNEAVFISEDPENPGYFLMKKVGKKIAGRNLDGLIWNEFPRGGH